MSKTSLDDTFSERNRRYFKESFERQRKKELEFLKFEAKYKPEVDNCLEELPWWRKMPIVWRESLQRWLSEIQVAEVFMDFDNYCVREEYTRSITSDCDSLSEKEKVEEKKCSGITLALQPKTSNTSNERYYYKFNILDAEDLSDHLLSCKIF